MRRLENPPLARRACSSSSPVRAARSLAMARVRRLRTVEATAEADEIPDLWRQFAFRSYLALQRIDSAVLEPYLPPAFFYNLVLSARKPS